MKPSQVVSLLLNLFITIPIWYYIVFTILTAIHPDRLIWFLFYIYMPAGLFSRILGEYAYPTPKTK
jgi:hypothetical protein